LKGLVADPTLDKQILQEMIRKKLTPIRRRQPITVRLRARLDHAAGVRAGRTTRSVLQIFEGHTNWVRAVAPLPDG